MTEAEKILELRKERGKKLDEAKKMLTKAETEQRDLNDQEQKRYKILDQEIDSLASDIAAAETELAEARKAGEGDSITVSGGYNTGGGQNSDGEIRMLKHNDSFAKAVTTEPLPDGMQLHELSLARMLKGMTGGGWKGAEAEMRALQGQEDPSGGYFLPGALSARLIDLSRARQVTSQAGAVTVPIEGDSLKVPKILADPSVQWRGELEEINASDPTFGAITLVPKVCAVLVKISQELYEDGKGIGDAVEQVMAQALATEKDKVALMGGGAGNANEPIGIYNTDGVSEISMGENGNDLTDYDDFLEAIEAVENANGSPAAVIMNPRTKADLAHLVTGISSDLTKLTPPEDYKNLRKFVTTAIPSDLAWGSSGDVCSAAFVGGFPVVWIGLRNNIKIDVSNASNKAFEEMALVFRAFIRMDVAIIRPAELAIVKGITTSR